MEKFGFHFGNFSIRKFCMAKTLMWIILSVIWILLLVQPGYNEGERLPLQRMLQSSSSAKGSFPNKTKKINDTRISPLPSVSTIGASRTEHSLLSSRKDLKANIILRRHPRYGIRECENFTIKPDTFDLTALVSFPGSGNTWTRHLIEFATGVFTGSIYCDVDLYGKGFLGEKEPWNSGSTIVQKLHLGYSSHHPFSKAILLIREPYQSIISFVQFLEAGHVGHASQSTFYNKKWPTYVLGQTFSWISLAKSWIESPAKLLVVHYEHLLTDAKKELRKICDFLNYDCSYIDDACFDRNVDGLFHRKGKRKPKVPLSKTVRDKVDKGIDFLSRLLILNGHDPIPVALYKFYRLKNETEVIFQ